MPQPDTGGNDIMHGWMDGWMDGWIWMDGAHTKYINSGQERAVFSSQNDIDVRFVENNRCMGVKSP